MGNSYVFHAPVVASAPLEWAIDFRTLFEEPVPSQGRAQEKTTVLFILKA